MTKDIVIGIALSLVLAGCAADGGCRSQAQCGSSESCVPPGVPRACGIPCAPDRRCESALDCDGGQVCAEYVATCCFAGELSSRCQPACDVDSCADGERCEASGLCVPVPCEEGYACPAHTSCTPAAASADAHGCARDACTSDASCEGGACVDGLCYEGPGTCEPPVP